ncbi:MAG: tape measure protein [Salinarimonas sp.]
MSGDAERLAVLLEARIREFERNMARAAGTANRRFGEIERRGQRAARNLQRSFGMMASTATGALGAALGVRQLRRYADGWTEAANKIAAAGETMGNVAARQWQLADVAMRSRSEFSATVDLYAGLRRATAAMGASQAQVVRVTETIGKAFSLSGTSAAAASGAITQLNQALQSGALRGDELNSVLEGAPALARAIADEFGVSVGELKALGEAGALTADRVFKAVLNGSTKIEAEFSRTNSTIAQSFQNLDTAMTRYIGQADQGAGASAKIAGAINGLAENIDLAAPLALSLGAALAAFAVGGPIAAGVAGLGTAFYLLGDSIRPIAADVASLADYAAVAFDLVKRESIEAADAMMAGFAQAADAISSALSSAGVDASSSFDSLLVAVKHVANAMIGGFVFAADTIELAFDNLGPAIADGVIAAVNAAIEAIERLANKAVEAINSVVTGINGTLGTGLGTVSPVNLGRIENAYAGVARRTGDAFAESIERNFSRDFLGDAFDASRAGLAELRRLSNERGEARLATRPAPVALDDGSLDARLRPFTPSAGVGTAPGGRARTGGAAGGTNAFDREVAQVEAAILALDRERQALGMNGMEAERTKMAHQLLDAARAAGVPITDELKSKVDALAQSYAASTQALERARETQQLLADVGKAFTDGLASGLADAIVEGKRLDEVFKELAKSLAKMLLQKAFSSLFGGMFGFADGGHVQGFATGGYVSGPGGPKTDSIPARLSDGEFVINAAATRRHLPLLEAINAGRVPAFAAGGLVGAPAMPAASFASVGNSGGMTVAPTINVSVEGGSRGEEADRSLAAKVSREIEGVMRQVVVSEMRRQMRPGGVMNNPRV